MSHFFPAEWSKQSAVMLSWPHSNTDWAPILERTEKTYRAITSAISRFQLVIIICDNETIKKRVESFFLIQPYAERIRYYIAPTDDTWIRDYGPLSIVKDHSPELLDFQFNGWGNKFEATKDNAVSLRLHQQHAFQNTSLHTQPIVLEGGSVESDGEGTLLTTRQCLLSPERNETLTQGELTHTLKQALGVQRVLWLSHGELEGDDTDGHIDTLVRFCSPSHLCYVRCDDPQDSHYIELQRMEDELKALRTANGTPYKLTPLPWPSPQYNKEGKRLPATYANFLIINGAVLLPVYNDNSDKAAINTLKACFPEHEIIPINCQTLIEQSGSLHCITMQLSSGVIK